MRLIYLKHILLIFLFTSCNASIDLGAEGETDPARGGQDSDTPNFPNIKVKEFEKEIFTLVNSHREKRGQNKLKWHDQAIVESQDHSQDMAAFRVPFGHTGSKLRFARIKANDTETIYKLGENVAKNSSAKKAFNAWLLSYGHRKNIEGGYTHTGIGAVKSANGSWYFTQIFLKK